MSAHTAVARDSHPTAARKNSMKPTHAMQFLSLAGIGTLMALGAAPAAAQEGSYYYGGLSVGRSQARIDEQRINASLLAAGLTSTGMSKDERDTAFKLFGGYQFNRHFALEAGYFNLGKFGFTSTTTPAGTLNGQIRLQGLNLDLVGTLPLTEKLSAIGRIGAQAANARDRFSGSGAVAVLNANPRKTEVNYKFGAGLQYAFSPSLLMRAEAERYRVNDAVGNRGGVNLLSVSLIIPFGRAPAVVARAPAPAYVAPAPEPMPAPAPVVVAAAPVAPVVPPPERRRVSFSADSLFSFDKSDVRAEGKAELDGLAKQLQGTRFDVVTVEGHTDRLGSTVYNQRLSEQRANSVKAYLVSSGGVDSGKVSAVGKGESAPVTHSGDCKGDRPSPKLIACLQPDRRVDVEVTGTR